MTLRAAENALREGILKTATDGQAVDGCCMEKEKVFRLLTLNRSQHSCCSAQELMCFSAQIADVQASCLVLAGAHLSLCCS